MVVEQLLNTRNTEILHTKFPLIEMSLKQGVP